MARRFPEETSSRIDPVEIVKNQHFDDMVLLLNRRTSVHKKRSEPLKLNHLFGIAYNESNDLIYVADHSVEMKGRVCIFNEEGEYIRSFGENELRVPIGVATNGRNVYICDSYHHAMFHYEMPEYQFVSRVGKEGSRINEFRYPRHVTTAINGDVYVADRANNRVVVMDWKLRFKRLINHHTMTNPTDVRLLYREVYVLSFEDNPCLHVFSVYGIKLSSLITQGKSGDYQVERGLCFCFDKQCNIIIGDYWSESIKIFSPAGALLGTLGENQEKVKKIKPTGIVFSSNNKIVCCSDSNDLTLHIFFLI